MNTHPALRILPALFSLEILALINTWAVSDEQASKLPQNGQRQCAAVQCALAKGDTEGNRERLAQLIAEAAKNGARYVVLPELSFTGPISDTVDGGKNGDVSETIPGPSTRFFGEYAKQLSVWIVLSLAETAADGAYYITAVLIDDAGNIRCKQRKVLLRCNGADNGATRGYARTVNDTVEDNGLRIGVLSGDDIEAGIPRLAERGADAVFIAAEWTSQDPVDWIKQCCSAAKEYNVNVVVANRCPQKEERSKADLLGCMVSRQGTVVVRTSSDQANGMMMALIGPRQDCWAIPSALGLPAVPIPSYERVVTPQVAELGRALFFDRNLSDTKTISCASCHEPTKAFSNGLPRGVGINGEKTQRKTPSLLNVAFKPTLFWDGLASTLENQAKYPLSAVPEMNFHYLDRTVSYVQRQPFYAETFRSVMGVENISFDDIAQALATYERTLTSGNAPFDRYYYAHQENAMNEAAKMGLKLFRGKGRCSTCHTMGQRYSHFSDYLFHNTGVGYNHETQRFADAGIGAISHSDKSGKFFTPSLRDVADTGPYMHDGSIESLHDVVQFYNQGGIPNAQLDPVIKPLGLTEEEINDLVAFLKALSGEHAYSESGERITPSRGQ